MWQAFSLLYIFIAMLTGAGVVLSIIRAECEKPPLPYEPCPECGAALRADIRRYAVIVYCPACDFIDLVREDSDHA